MNLRNLLTTLNPFPKEVLIYSNWNNRELRWTHSRAMVDWALDSILGSPREVWGQESQRKAWEEFRLDCFFLKFKGEYPHYCAIQGWRNWYRDRFDEAIEPLLAPEEAPKYSASQLLLLGQAFMPALPECRSAEELAWLVPPPRPRPVASQFHILWLARALFSALPPCRHLRERNYPHLWYCGPLPDADAWGGFKADANAPAKIA